jgi:hypothetical protein
MSSLKLVLRAIKGRLKVGEIYKSPLLYFYSNAMGLTGEPVPPTTRNGLTVSMNS